VFVGTARKLWYARQTVLIRVFHILSVTYVIGLSVSLCKQKCNTCKANLITEKSITQRKQNYSHYNWLHMYCTEKVCEKESRLLVDRIIHLILALHYFGRWSVNAKICKIDLTC
jgi:hypothetical protein